MTGFALVAALLAGMSLWYGGAAFVPVVRLARLGILHVPALVIGALELWIGGLLALAAGTLVREPPGLPRRVVMIGWSAVVLVAVLRVVLLRRPDVEAALPEATRRTLDGRFIALGAVAAAAVLFWAGYLLSALGR